MGKLLYSFLSAMTLAGVIINTLAMYINQNNAQSVTTHAIFLVICATGLFFNLYTLFKNEQ